jgi:hypothetical protein
MTEINIDMASLTNLTSDSLIILNIGKNKYTFKPISLIDFVQYERLSKEEKDSTDGKAFLISVCSIEPKYSLEEAEKLPAGLGAVMVSNLLRASFLMLPASNE